MAKPTLKPRWASTVTADPTRYFEPPALKKDIGWDTGERPPAQYENWLRGVTGLWIDYLDGFEYDEVTNTWSSRQIFAPSTAEAAIVVGYNSGVPAGATNHPSIGFRNADGTISPVVDRLGAPSLKWKQRSYDWQGRVLVGTILADTDYEVQDEVCLWLRNSGAGPAMVSNVFSAKVNDPSVGSTLGDSRELVVSSQFESIIGQYNLLYGDPICAKLDTSAFALVLDTRFAFRQFGAVVSNYQAFGLYRKETLGAGLTGRDPLVQDHLLLVHSRGLGTIQVSYRDGGVSDALVDTGKLPGTRYQVRFEIVDDPNMGGPYTAVWIDGTKVYSVNKVHAGVQFAYAFAAIAKPISIESGVGYTEIDLYPVQVNWTTKYM